MGEQLAEVSGPEPLAMIILSLIFFICSAVIWTRRAEPRKSAALHISLTILLVQAFWGVTWLLYGLKFWNGFIAPVPMILKVSAKMLPYLLKAM